MVLKTEIFDELQLKQISLNIPGFLQVISARYNVKAELAGFLTVPVVLKIFRIQDEHAYSSFLIAQNISKATNGF